MIWGMSETFVDELIVFKWIRPFFNDYKGAINFYKAKIIASIYERSF